MDHKDPFVNEVLKNMNWAVLVTLKALVDMREAYNQIPNRQEAPFPELVHSVGELVFHTHGLSNMARGSSEFAAPGRRTPKWFLRLTQEFIDLGVKGMGWADEFEKVRHQIERETKPLNKRGEPAWASTLWLLEQSVVLGVRRFQISVTLAGLPLSCPEPLHRRVRQEETEK